VSATLGQLDSARAHAHEALTLAEAAGDDQARIEATLAGAEVELMAENLQAAVNAFNHAVTLAQAREAVVAEVAASVGLGRVLLRRGLWEEAATVIYEALPRLRAAGDLAGQTLAHLSLGEARRNLNDNDASRAAFADASRLARASDNRLLEAEALSGEARLLLGSGELEASTSRYGQALESVERIGASVADIGDRATFFDGYAALYAEAIFALARELASARVAEMASAYAARATKAGSGAAAQRLRDYARSMTTSGKALTPERQSANKAISALLDSARKTLTR
jgi:hypothetical protein